MKLIEPAIIKRAVVIYKTKSGAIIKQRNNRAIYIYNHAKDLKLGHSYTLQINQIMDYNGLKEVESFSILDEKGQYSRYKSLLLDAKKKDILKPKYENEIFFNLKGTIKNRKLYIEDSNGEYIQLYAKNKKYLPKDNSTIIFKNAHVGIYRGNPQILIHNKSDYEIIK